MRFEPSGMTDDPDVRMAVSVLDYIFRRLALDYLPFEQRSALGIYSAEERKRQLETGSYQPSEEEMYNAEDVRSSAPVAEPHDGEPSGPASSAPSAEPPAAAHSSTELVETQQNAVADAPLCLTCGTKMRPAGSCYVCEGCGSTSGCS
jgi:ribonucleoside-diphosphate reductase alpha chain